MTQLKRLLDEPGSDLDRVLLEAGMDDEPPKAALDRTLVALGVGSATAIGAGALGASGAGATLGGAKGLFGPGLAKWLGGALLAGSVVGGSFVITQRAAVSPAAMVTSQVDSERKGPVAPVLVAQAAYAPEADQQAGQPAMVSPKSQRSAAEVSPDAPTEARPASGAKASEPTADKGNVEKAKTDKAKTSEPSSAKGNANKGNADKGNADKAKPDLTAGGGSLSDEVRMLDSARKALSAGDNDACLASLASYSSKFPKGQLLSDAQAMRASCSSKKAAPTP